jgi:hypothetical protein
MSAVNVWLASMAQSCYRCHAEDQLVAWAMDEGLATIPGTAQRLAAGGAACLCSSRFKPQDDATALLFEIEALR